MLNLGPIINQRNLGGRGVSGLGNPGGGRGLEVQEIQEEGGGGQKLLPSVGGVWIFSGITHFLFVVPYSMFSIQFNNYVHHIF